MANTNKLGNYFEYTTHLCRENLLVGMGYVLANLLASWLDLNWD